MPGIVVYRWEAPLFFANAGAFRQQIRQPRRTSATPRWIVLQCEAITDIDVTAAEMLEQLDNELNAAGHAPGVRRDAQPAPGLVVRYGLLRDPRPRPLLPDASDTALRTRSLSRSLTVGIEYRSGISRTR